LILFSLRNRVSPVSPESVTAGRSIVGNRTFVSDGRSYPRTRGSLIFVPPVQCEIAHLREMISNRQQHIPITELIGRLNLHLPGWKNYYGKRHCGMAMHRINWQVENRLRKHLRRRDHKIFMLILKVRIADEDPGIRGDSNSAQLVCGVAKKQSPRFRRPSQKRSHR
jgi:Group II intron, maturase-specific domain